MMYCVYCGNPASAIDHIIPLALGGTDDPENLVPACKHCNSVKHDVPPVEFLKRLLKVNGLPFKYEVKPPLPEETYLVEEHTSGSFKLRLFRDDNHYWFKLVDHNQLLLAGELLALKLLGYTVMDFQKDDISDLFTRLEMMHWLCKQLSPEDKQALAEGV